MSKKKKILFALISIAVLIAVQIYFLTSYDHFKAEGGLKIEMLMDPNDVPKKYARTSLDYDFVMKDAVRTYNSKGGDFLEVLAQSNKDRSAKSLVHLLNYKEIGELSMDSKDDEVIAFLRDHLDRNLAGTADLYKSKMERGLNKEVDVSFNTTELSLTIKVPGQKDSLDAGLFTLPQVNLGFYECFTMSELSSVWHTACQLTEPDEMTEDEWELSDLNKSTIVSTRTLANTVQWPYQGVGFVKDQDKEFVMSTLRSEELDGVFPDNLSFHWSKSTQSTDQGNVWQLYALRIPKSGRAIISNEDIFNAQFVPQGTYGQPVLDIRMTSEGTDKWAKMTEENLNRIIAMCVNGVVYSAPNVVGPIMDGNTQLTGGDGNDFKDIEIVLNSNSIEILPIEFNDSFVKADPPLLNALIQKILLGLTIFLLLFLVFKFFTAPKVNSVQTT